MTSTPQVKRGNGITSRLAVLEHAVASLVNEQTEMRDKLSTLYGYVFGDASTTDPLKSQVKRIDQEVSKLSGFLTIVQDIKVWKDQVQSTQKTIKDDRRQYKYMLVGAVISSSVSLILGLIIGRMTP